MQWFQQDRKDVLREHFCSWHEDAVRECPLSHRRDDPGTDMMWTECCSAGDGRVSDEIELYT